MPSLAFRLRLFWYRLDKEACLAALAFGAIIGALAFAVQAVMAQRDEALRQLQAQHAQNLACLARNVYFEARGEPEAGQYAVAEVTMNRRAHPRYPNTVCEVVHQKSAFSWTDFSLILEAPRGDEWERAQRIAEAVYYGKRLPTLNGALFYHATYVSPDWSHERQRVTRIGRHVFYR